MNNIIVNKIITTKNIICASVLITTSIFSALILAAEKNHLTVYTYSSFVEAWGPGPHVKKAFEAECDCIIDFVGLDDGVSMLNRLRLEGTNTKADILLGIDTNLIEEAKQTGLLAEHRVDTSSITLPNGWRDSTFIPYDFSYFAFIYNSEKVTQPPTSLKELIETRNDLKVIYQDPRTSSLGQGLLLWVKSVYGEDAKQAWKALASKTVTVAKSWSEAYAMFLAGESDLVLSYTTSPAYHVAVEKESKYVAANFTEGHYMQVEVVAKLKNNRNDALADQFMNFVLSDKFQSIIPTTNWMYPVTNVELPEEFKQLVTPSEVLAVEPKQVLSKRKSWIKEWQNALTF